MGRAGVLGNPGELFLRPLLEREMHSRPGRCEVGSDRFRIPALGMESNNDAPTFDGVFDLSKALEAPRARRLGTAGKNQFDRLGTGTSAKLDKADGSNFMRTETWIFSMQINDFLPDRGRECAFILPGDRRWWLWWQ